MKKITLSVILIAGMLLASCASAAEPSETQTEVVEQASDGSKPVIGLVMKSLGAEFFKSMEEGAIAHAEERGDLELIPLGTESQSELDQQIAIVENLIAQEVDAIVIAPMDSKALVAPVARAIKAGIKVINIDVNLDADAMADEGIDVAFVGPDNTSAAKMVGDVLGKELGEGGKVIIIEGNPGADNAQQRKDGFMQSVEEYNLEVLASQTAHWEAEEANTVFTNLLTANPDVKGVMCANDAMALGVVNAIDAAGMTGKIKVVGFDNDPSIQPLIKEGKVLATVDQFGSQMAAYGIDYAMDELAGEELTGWIKTDVKLVTAEDLE